MKMSRMIAMAALVVMSINAMAGKKRIRINPWKFQPVMEGAEKFEANNVGLFLLQNAEKFISSATTKGKLDILEGHVVISVKGNFKVVVIAKRGGTIAILLEISPKLDDGTRVTMIESISPELKVVFVKFGKMNWLGRDCVLNSTKRKELKGEDKENADHLLTLISGTIKKEDAGKLVKEIEGLQKKLEAYAFLGPRGKEMQGIVKQLEEMEKEMEKDGRKLGAKPKK